MPTKTASRLRLQLPIEPTEAMEQNWVDAILDPAKTREALLLALEAAAHNPEVERFHPGVLQT